MSVTRSRYELLFFPGCKYILYILYCIWTKFRTLFFISAIFAGMKIWQIKKVGNVFMKNIQYFSTKTVNGCSRSLLYHNEIYIYNKLDSKTRNFMHLYFQCPKVYVYYMPSILDACSKELKENNIYLYVTRQFWNA